MHRPVFEIKHSHNDFWQLSIDGEIIHTGNAVAYPPKEIVEKIQQHLESGYHPDCVICQENKKGDMK